MGWAEDTYYYLLPRISCERIKASGVKLTVKPVALYRQLFEEGFLETDPESDRMTVVTRVGE